MGEDSLTLGQRVAVYRRLRGLTQHGLALRLHRSVSWVTKVERGARRVDSTNVLLELSRALAVPVERLTRNPGSVSTRSTGWGDLANLRQVFNRTARLHPSSHPSTSIDGLDIEATSLRRAYNAGHAFSVALASLPDFIGAAQHASAVAVDGDRAAANRALANLSRLGSLAFRQYGDVGWARLAIDRALVAAEQADDALLLASIAATMTIQLMLQGDPDDAVALALDASTLVRRSDAKQLPGLVVAGALHLYAAQAAARAGDRPDAKRLLGTAAGFAERLGRDAERYCLIFGPTNVAIQTAGIMVDLGLPEEAITRASSIQPERLASSNRACFHYLHLARAQGMIGNDDEAIDAVARAFQSAPGITRHDSLTRDLVRGALRRRRNISEQLRRLAANLEVMEDG